MTLSTDEEERIVARERLRILTWGYYIHGGFTALMMSFVLLPFLFMMLAVSTIPASQWNKRTPTVSPTSSSFQSPTPQPASTQEPPPKIVIGIFAAIFGAVVFGNVTVAGLSIYAGRCIQKRKHKTFIYIVAAVNCIFIPYGTLLGVFTMIVLGSSQAIAEFRSGALPATGMS